MTGVFYLRSLRFDKKKISVPSKYLSKLFSSKYNKVKKDCLNTTLDFKEPYSVANGKCNKYEMKRDCLKGEVVKYSPMVSNKFIEKVKMLDIDEYGKGYKAEHILGDNRVSIQNQFLLDIRKYYNEKEVFPILDDLLEEKTISEETYHKNCDLINGFEKCGKYFTKSPDANGRVYNILSLSKRECRHVLADEYSEVDISNSHPFVMGAVLQFLQSGDWQRLNRETNFIGVLKRQLIELNEERGFFEKEILNGILNLKLLQMTSSEWVSNNNIINQYSNNNTFSSLIILSVIYQILNYDTPTSNTYHFDSDELRSEIIMLHNDTRNGDFYKNVIERGSIEMSLFHKHAKMLGKNYIPSSPMELTDKQCEKIIKTSFMFWMNAKKSKESIFFRTLYPNISKLLSHLKEVCGKTAIHKLITSIESNFVFKVIDVCNTKTNMSRPFLVGSLHDAFYVPNNKIEIVTDIIGIQGNKMFNSTVPYRIKN